MASVEELKTAIEELQEADYRSFREWFIERDHEKWDREIEADSRSGKLDLLIKEAETELSHRSLEDIY